MFWLNLMECSLVRRNRFISLIVQEVFFVIRNICPIVLIRFRIKLNYCCFAKLVHLYLWLNCWVRFTFYSFRLKNDAIKSLLRCNKKVWSWYLFRFSLFIRFMRVLVMLICLNINLDCNYYFLIVSIFF